MSLFRRREPPLPKAAVCFALPFRTRHAADWLGNLGGCRPIGVLSDDCDDVVWQCAAEQADLLLLETDFTEGVEDKDVSARCDIAIEVKRKLPDCRVYLILSLIHIFRFPEVGQPLCISLRRFKLSLQRLKMCIRDSIGPEGPIHQGAVDEVTADQQCQTE